jgi:hypothetical protein
MNLPRILLIAALYSAITAAAQTYPTYNLDRPYTLRILDYSPLLGRYHDITVGEAPQTFFYPQIDSSFRQSRDSSALLFWYAENGNAGLHIRPLFAWDIRGGKDFGDTINGYEGGVFLSGYVDSAEFWLDARIFSEAHSNDNTAEWRSWDREFLETQGNKDIEDEVKYSSYARYRGHFALRMGWAALDFARDARHWGPGYFNNLTLNQGAVPYNQISLTTKIGHLSVISLYGDLDPSSPGGSSMNKEFSRNLYGHRYEFDFGNLMLGISEITVVYDINPYWLFVPIVPLFAEKGNYNEDHNNGAIAFDFSYRFPIGLRIYSEFFLDDMESPSSLFRNDNIEAKWAWMAGAEYAMNFGEWKMGSIAEYARIEPYVYTHFDPNTVQMAHLGYPIGSQAGPNSQNIDWLFYAKHAKHFQTQLKQSWSWKGLDGGSIDSLTPRNDHFSTPKKLLDGAKMNYSLTPAVIYMSNHYAISAEYTFFDKNAFCSRAMVLW